MATRLRLFFSDGGDDVITKIDWIDNKTKINNLGPPMVLLSGHTNKKYRKKIALVKTTEPYSVESLPDMPETIYRPGVIRQRHTYTFLMAINTAGLTIAHLGEFVGCVWRQISGRHVLQCRALL